MILSGKMISFHLQNLKRWLESSEYEEDLMEDADETHFVLNLENGRKLVLKADEVIKYAEFLSGNDLVTMTGRLTGGKHACVQPYMLIIMNQNSSYPICRVRDDVPGVCCCSSPKGWMDGATWKK